MQLTAKVRCKDQFDIIRQMDENDVINITVGDAIKALWTDPGISSIPLFLIYVFFLTGCTFILFHYFILLGVYLISLFDF